MQVYKRLNIGTAKITENEKENIPHHLFDIVNPKDMYTVFDYQIDGRNKIKEILNRGKRVIIVGGTGLYIKALLYNYEFKKEDKTYDFNNMTNEELFSKIQEYNPDISIHINNRKRLERYLTKLLNNNIDSNNGNEKVYDFSIIGLTTERENLYNIINSRVDKMIDSGLIEEVKSLYDDNIRSKAINTGIGYKELYLYFDGKITYDEAIDLIKKNSRRYAKRQYTFFNNKLDVNWFKTNYEDFSKTIEDVIKFLEGE